MLRAVRKLAILAFGLVVACGDREGNEARLFLDRVEQIDIEAPPEVRRDRIDALASIAIESTDVKRTRDLCVEAHRTLLDAEAKQASAQADLDRITAGGTD